jgi:hypothetical protein
MKGSGWNYFPSIKSTRNQSPNDGIQPSARIARRLMLALAHAMIGENVMSYRELWFIAVVFTMPANAETVVLYDQDFERPASFINDGGDVNIYAPVNDLYGNQPTGFTFAQANTVETLLITGDQAFGQGYTDLSGKGGNYAIGMLSDYENDLLGLSFNLGNNDFLNLRIDISSIDLSVFGGPFVPPDAEPIFEFTLYDNPAGLTGIGDGVILDSMQVSGLSSNPDEFVWTEVLMPLSAEGNTNGNVILRIDLINGGYAAMDNFRIAASNTPGDVGEEKPEISVRGGYIKLDTTTENPPPNEDCQLTSHVGRMVYYDGSQLLFLCSSSGWILK